MLIIPLHNKNEWEARFWAKVDKSGNCWEWTGARTRSKVTSKNPNSRHKIHDYGVISLKDGKSRTYKAHRVSYVLNKGAVEDGLVIDHLCKNTLCVNPDHLEAVTGLENVKRGNGHSKLDRCINGHEYTYDTLYVYYSGKYPNGRRGCRTCLVVQKRKFYLKNKPNILANRENINRRRREVALLKRLGRWQDQNTPSTPS